MLKRLVAIPLALFLTSGVAWAYWSAVSGAGGNGASAATTVNQGATPTASAIGNAVTVSWAASTLSNGNAVAGYIVKRYDVTTVTLQTILSACTGTVAATTCTENSAPTGQWVYSVTPVFATNWSGAESLKSNAVTVAASDATAPVNAISMSVGTGNASKSGDTIYYRGSAAGSFTLANAVSDSGSGPASSATAVLGGTTTGWTHSPSTVSTPSGGPYLSTLFSWTAGATSAPTEIVTGRDVAGNTAATTLTFVNDSTGPTGGSVAASGLVGTGSRYAASTTLSLTLATGTDPSGVAATGAQLWRSTSALTSAGTADGVCATFVSYTLVTTDPASPKSDTVADQACYSYQYVVSDTLGTSTTYTSPDIKVDTTVPTAPTLAFSGFTNTYWSGTGSTVYYRSAAATGTFTATASATDTKSGIASYAFPALGTNWTSTPGALGVNTYSWTVTPPAAPGSKSVTATNNATGTSAGASFTLTDDITTPAAGTVTYTGGTNATTSVTVALTTGTDSGSGLGTRLLQRASAILTGGSTCGAFGAFFTVANGTNPTSPVVDTVGGKTCYKYQYVVSDNVGNSTTASSASVVWDTASYLATINGTGGLLSYWRLGEATTSYDTFSTGSAGTKLQDRSGEIGASWTNVDRDAVITNGGRIRRAAGDPWALYYSSGIPASADYTVEADVYVASLLTNDVNGITGRHTSSAFYAAVYDQPNLKWTLYSVVSGAKTSIGTPFAQTLTAGATHRLALDMNGSTIRLLVDGVERISVVDTTITAVGKGGVTLGFVGTPNFTVTDTTGMQLDNFRVTPPLADGKGTNTGDYLSGTTLGAAGAITGDANTAAQFDGINDFGTVSRQISDDFSIELWFKSTQGIGVNNTSWSQGAGLVDADVTGSANDFGVSLGSDGKVVAGVGTPDVSIVSAGGYDDGLWHHVVFTRTKSTGALQLYIDGVSTGSATGSTASLTSPTNINFGRLATGTNYFSGTLDEVAVYTTVLTGPTVTSHYNASK